MFVASLRPEIACRDEEHAMPAVDCGPVEDGLGLVT